MLQLHERLRILREEAGVSQREFAEIGGVTITSQQNYERGSRTPNVEYLQRLIAASIDVQYLLTGKKSEGAVVPDGFMVMPRLAATASMGKGIYADDRHNAVVEQVIISITWIHQHLSTFSGTKNLHIITGKGDSMSDTFEDGDTLIVDAGVQEMLSDGIYVFNLDDEIYVKRLQRHPKGKIAMISDNPRYKSIMLDSRSDLRIIGKIVGTWQFRKL